jgi:hypothetical protein
VSLGLRGGENTGKRRLAYSISCLIMFSMTSSNGPGFLVEWNNCLIFSRLRLCKQIRGHSKRSEVEKSGILLYAESWRDLLLQIEILGLRLLEVG